MQIPNWLSEIVKNFQCPVCKVKMSEDCVSSFGWRDNEKDPEKDFFIDYLCKSCEKKIVIPLGSMDLENFSMQVMEEVMDGEIDEELDQEEIDKYDSGEPESYKKSDPNAKKAKKRLPKSKINDDEVLKFVDRMNSCESFDDFLNMIGLTEEKLKEYNDMDDKDK